MWNKPFYEPEQSFAELSPDQLSLACVQAFYFGIKTAIIKHLANCELLQKIRLFKPKALFTTSLKFSPSLQYEPKPKPKLITPLKQMLALYLLYNFPINLQLNELVFTKDECHHLTV